MRIAGSPVAVGSAVLVLALAAVLLAPEAGRVAAWGPAAAIAVAGIACSTGGRRALVLLVVGGAVTAADLIGGRSLDLALCFAAATVAEAGVAGGLLAREGRPVPGTRLRAGRLLGAAAAGAAVAGTVAAAAVVSLRDGDGWTTWWSVAAAHGAAVLVVGALATRLPVEAVRRWAASADRTTGRAVQHRLRASLAFRDAVLAVSPDVTFIFDPVTHTNLWVSPSPAGLTGHSDTERSALGDAAVGALVHPDDVPRIRVGDTAACDLPDGAVFKLRVRVLDRDGGYRWVSRRVTPFARDDAGAVTQLLGVARDITENVALEERLAAAALHDPLTGLPNRRLLQDRLQTALHRAARSGGPVPVLYCDLDEFKTVNDSAGHAVGDAVLCVTAERLTAVLRPQDTVARVGGDEFVAVLDPALRTVDHGAGDGAAEVRRQARSVARRIVAALAEPIVVDGVSHVVSVSIGVTFSRPGEQPEQALHDADRAMYHAKLRGKGRHEEFDGAVGLP